MWKEDQVSMFLYVPKDLRKKVKTKCASEGITFVRLINEFLEQYVKTTIIRTKK